MARWLILSFAVLVNAIGVFYALLPALITYAETIPPGVTCSLCTKPEVQLALIKAALYGRHQVLFFAEQNTWIIFSVGALNVAIVGAVLFLPALIRRSRGMP